MNEASQRFTRKSSTGFKENPIKQSFSVGLYLDRENEIDMLDVEPSSLHLYDRLRQRRQREKAIGEGDYLLEDFRTASLTATETITKAQELADYNKDHKFDLASQFNSQEEINSFLLSHFSNFPKSRRMRMVCDALAGMSIEKISSKYDVDNPTVSRSFSPFRRLILEPTILTPLGFARSASTSQDLINAVGNKKLMTHEILFIHYVTPRQLADFEMKRKKIDPELLNSGMVLIDSECSAQEWEAITRNPYYSGKILKKNGRLYISLNELAEFRQAYHPRIKSNSNPKRQEMSRTEFRRQNRTKHQS